MIEHFNDAIEQLTAEGQPFAITTTEVRGVPVKAYAVAPPNMRLIWEASAAYGDADYVVYEDERYSYTDAHAHVRSLAHALVDTYGVLAGDRVAVAMRNYPEWIMSYWAITSIGAAIVGMNAWWTGPEMEYGLRDASPKVLICDHERLHNVEPHLTTLRAEHPLDVIAVRTEGELPDGVIGWGDVVDPASAPATLPSVDIHPDDDACIFYTSGTTSFPKGAQLTHRGSVANLMNMGLMPAAAGIAKQMAGLEVPDPADVPPPSVLLPVPLFHVTGCNCVLHPVTAAGGKLVSMYKWDTDNAIDLIEREKITVFTGVPTMSRELLLSPKWAMADTSSIAAMGGGGAALQPDLVEKIDEGLDSGVPQTGYGLTETHGIATSLSDVFFLAKPDSCGPIVPTLEAKIVDDDGNELPDGQLGELIMRGSNVIKGYLNRPEDTAEAIRDGWFYSGDIAFLEDGFVHIRDRKKDIVIRGGENIHCGEVESAIYEHPAVAEAAVFGVPDDRLGEEVGVAIVLAADTHLDEAELRAHLEDRLARFKIPAYVWFRDEPLPRNANGKFVKRDLRNQLLRD
ncbi:MAG: acyl--CoA ligase [Actinomycetia bacterium]|nr:acyl--CoA ligase [Actinomycetes bacterium]